MTKRPTSAAEREQRKLQHQDNAEAAIGELIRDCELRALPLDDVFKAFARVLAAHNPELCGKIIYGVGEIVRREPIKKIIGASTVTVDPERSYGPAN